MTRFTVSPTKCLSGLNSEVTLSMMGMENDTFRATLEGILPPLTSGTLLERKLHLYKHLLDGNRPKDILMPLVFYFSSSGFG